MPSYHITIHGADWEAMVDLVPAQPVRVSGQTLNDDAATLKLGEEA